MPKIITKEYVGHCVKPYKMVLASIRKATAFAISSERILF